MLLDFLCDIDLVPLLSGGHGIVPVKADTGNLTAEFVFDFKNIIFHNRIINNSVTAWNDKTAFNECPIIDFFGKGFFINPVTRHKTHYICKNGFVFTITVNLPYTKKSHQSTVTIFAVKIIFS